MGITRVLFIVVDSSVEWGNTDHMHNANGPSHYLLSELDDQRQLVGLDESQEFFFGQLSVKGIAPLIKL